MKRSLTVLLLLSLCACTLNSKQEASLQNAINAYVDARNNGVLMTYVSLTHPNAVAYYKDLGDSVFTQRFDLSQGDNALYLSDGHILEMNSEEDEIHVEYEYVGVDMDYYDEMNSIVSKKVRLFAISLDQGETWYFMDEKDYKDKAILSPKDRLIQ